MLNFFTGGSKQFLPHGFCMAWQPGVLWLNVISDFCIALAYFSIPIALLYFVKKRKDLVFNWMFKCFAVFITACGTTHLVEIWNVWNPSYLLMGTVKAITALASIPTAILLVRLIPSALLLPSPTALKVMNSLLLSEITERKNAEEALQARNIELEVASEAIRESEERFRFSFEHAAIGMALVGPNGRWLQVNQALCKMLEMNEEDLLSKTFQDITFPADLDLDLAHVNKLLRGEQNHYQMEKRYITRSGRVIWANLSVSLVRDQKDTPIHFVSLIENITERKNNEHEIKRMAFHDALTNLPNRRLIADRISQEIFRAQRENFFIAVGFIDVDHFKVVNDSFGHDVGDELLRVIAKRLSSCLRESDTLGRQGGDEFVFLSSRLRGEQDALLVAAKMMNEFKEPLTIQGVTLQVGLSIGVAINSPRENIAPEELLKKADKALYEVKTGGRNAIRLFQEK